MEQGVSGYFDIVNSQYGITLRVHYSETYEISTNSSVVNITKLQVATSNNPGMFRYLYGSVKIDTATAVTMDSRNGTHSVYVSTKNAFYDVTGTMGSISMAHDDNGRKNVTIDASVTFIRDTGASAESISGNKTISLTTIHRASSFTVANGTLGTSQTIKVTRQSTALSHTITYKCGVASGTVCDKSTKESISFTPPIDLAEQNTAGTSVTVTFTLQTYSGTTAIGSAVSKSVSMAIPASVKPKCSILYTDTAVETSRWGGHIQGVSRLDVAVTGDVAYGSPIASYQTTVDGTTYTQSSFTTGVLSGTGSQTISATVTDKRGRTSSSAKATINVLEYTAPKISKLSVHRCNEDGTTNNVGSWVKVTYSFSITSLSDQNTKIVELEYKKSSDDPFTKVTLSSTKYSATNATYVFKADDGSSYDIKLTAKDSFRYVTKTTSVSTAAVIMHFKSDGTGMGIGKVSEKSNTLDVGWNVEMNGKSLTKNGEPYANIYGSLKSLGITTFPTTMSAVAAAMPSNSMIVIDTRTIRSGGEEEISDWGNSTNGTAYINKGYSVARVTMVILYGSGTSVKGKLIVGSWANNTNKVGWVDYGYDGNESYPNCFYRPISGESEWINSPMVLGEEYRTTDRWNGKVVYTKLVNYNGMPNSNRYAVSHGAAATQIVRCAGMNITTGMSIPCDTISVFADKTNITIVTTANHSSHKAYVQIWYTKD